MWMQSLMTVGSQVYRLPSPIKKEHPLLQKLLRLTFRGLGLETSSQIFSAGLKYLGSQVVPFCHFSFGVPLLTPDSIKKGTLIY